MNPQQREQLKERVIQLWNENECSAQRIAYIVNGEFGSRLSRNAVIGITHRNRARCPLRDPAVSTRIKQESTSDRTARLAAAKEFKQRQEELKQIQDMGEPEYIGPIEEIPEGGACQCMHLHETPQDKGWRMCGQPADPRANGRPICQWHFIKWFSPKAGQPATRPDDKRLGARMYRSKVPAYLED